MRIMPTDPLFYVIGLSAVFLMALGKGAFGGGLAVLGAPLLALVVDPITATIMMSPIVSAADPFGIMAFPPKTWSWTDLRWISIGILIGLALGSVFFVALDPRIVALGLSLITLYFAARYFLYSGRPSETDQPIHPLKAIICGTLGGFTTFIAHGGGPPVAFYLLPRGLPKSVYAGTTIAVFAFANTVKLGLYVWLTGFNPHIYMMALVLMPAVPIGVFAGKLLHDRLDEKRLYFWCYLLIGLAGLRLLVDSLQKLFWN
jgi:uncharacterized membrane protein YfcA